MNVLDFQSWSRMRDARPPKQMPECDRLLRVVVAAGQRGISRVDLGREIKLDIEMLDALISTFERLGQIAITQHGTDQIIRSSAYSPR